MVGRVARRLGRAVRVALALLAVAAGPSAHAAPSDDARALLEQAAAHVATALETAVPRTPDHGGWREALALGRRALTIDDGPGVHRFLARTYALVGWSVRSLEHFEALLALGADLDDPPGAVLAPPDVSTRELFAAAASDLGFSRAQVGDLDGAVAVYERWLEVLPDDLDAVRRLGAAHLQRSDPVAALPYWERLVAADPDDANAAFHLGEARRAAAVGSVAAAAFRAGVGAFDAGAFDDALAAFDEALRAAPNFADAAVWAGRSALELGRPAQAVPYWERAVALRPDDGGARYFLRVARDQAQHGIPAAQAFHAGLVAYEGERVEEALEAFERAVGLNDGFTEAWAWLARVRQESGRFDDAVAAWQRVVELDPLDERARYFLALVRQQATVGAEAGAAFAEGVAAYEAADFETAVARFREAVGIDPAAVQAWVWLGRVYFTLARFEEAAEAYARAARLDPGDDDIAFFAAEAAALAAPDEPSDPEADDVEPADGDEAP